FFRKLYCGYMNKIRKRYFALLIGIFLTTAGFTAGTIYLRKLGILPIPLYPMIGDFGGIPQPK
ncbi:MAG TPA: hypothetical protein V6C72_06720, partial [Chroococcales cyanobacterium]